MIHALAKLLEGKIVEEGSVSRTDWALVQTESKSYLFLTREWNGKTSYIINPTPEQIEQARTNAFDFFSEVPRMF